MTETRFSYLVAAIPIILAGLASRKYREHLPQFLAEYSGDTLWALMLFLLAGALLVGKPIVARAAVSLAIAFLVEISQLYHAPWIDSVRQTTLGGVVLGSPVVKTIAQAAERLGNLTSRPHHIPLDSSLQ